MLEPTQSYMEFLQALYSHTLELNRFQKNYELSAPQNNFSTSSLTQYIKYRAIITWIHILFAQYSRRYTFVLGMICHSTYQFQYFPTHTFEFMHLISSLALIHTLLLLLLVYSCPHLSFIYLVTTYYLYAFLSQSNLLLVCFVISISLQTPHSCSLLF